MKLGRLFLFLFILFGHANLAGAESTFAAPEGYGKPTFEADGIRVFAPSDPCVLSMDSMRMAVVTRVPLPEGIMESTELRQGPLNSAYRTHRRDLCSRDEQTKPWSFKVYFFLEGEDVQYADGYFMADGISAVANVEIKKGPYKEPSPDDQPELELILASIAGPATVEEVRKRVREHLVGAISSNFAAFCKSAKSQPRYWFRWDSSDQVCYIVNRRGGLDWSYLSLTYLEVDSCEADLSSCDYSYKITCHSARMNGEKWCQDMPLEKGTISLQ